MATGPLTEMPCLEGSANSWGQSEPVAPTAADRSDANRCKRTDGKKWRCTKEVVPEQKYCERHMHRGRHRTRKLQEGQSPGMAACIAAANGVSRMDSAWQTEQYRSLAAACGAGNFGAVAAAAAAAKGGGDRVTASLSGASISDRIPLAFSQGLICGMHSGLWDPVNSGRKFGPASSLQPLNGVHKDPRLFDRADLYWAHDKPCGVATSMNPFLPHDLLANLNKNSLSTAASLQSLPQTTTANALRNLVGKVPLSAGGNGGHGGPYAASIIPYDTQLRALLTQQQPIMRASSASAVAASMGMGGACNANGSSNVGGVSATQGTMSIDIGKDSGGGNVEVRSFIDTWPVRWTRNDVSSASAEDARLQVGRGTSSLSMSIPSPAAAELAARALSSPGGKLSPPRISTHKSDEVDMNRDPTHMGLGVGISLEREEVDQRSHAHTHHHHHHHQQAAGTTSPPDAQGLAWTMTASGWDVGGPLGEVLHTTTPRGSSTTSAASDSTKADSPGGTQQGFNLLGDGFGQSLRVAGTAGMSGGGELSSLGGSSLNGVSVSQGGGLGVDCSPRDGSTGRMEAFPRATLRKSGNFVSLAESSSGESGHGRGDGGGGDGSELGGCVRGGGGGGNVGSATGGGGATGGTVNGGGPGGATAEGTGGAGSGSILVEGGGLDFVSNLGISSRPLSLSASGTMESACGSGHASENYGVAFPHCDGDVRHLSIDWSL